MRQFANCIFVIIAIKINSESQVYFSDCYIMSEIVKKSKGRPRTFNKENALKIALHLFWRHGFEGVSIANLAQSMGINIPSLYAAFGNKEKLFFQAVELYGKTNANIYEPALAKTTAFEVAKAILLSEVDLVTNQDAPNGCLMVQGALVASPESQGLSDMMAKLRATAETWLEQRFQKAINEGDLPKNANAKSMACFIMTINSGIAVQARTGVDKEQLIEIVKMSLLSFPWIDVKIGIVEN